jgi:16S rRNA (guanine1207-N2)-methyltransferase
MTTDRLTHCLDQGMLSLPDSGTIAVFGLPHGAEAPEIARDRLQVIDTLKTTHVRLGAQGIDCRTAPEGPFAAAIVHLGRARDLNQARIHQAVAHTPGGMIVIDGAKTEGVESILKALKGRLPIEGQVSKHHGKVAWFTSQPVFDDWANPGPTKTNDGWFTAPGVFSADGIDPASKALAELLPKKLGPHVIDLGAGWGYLSANALKRDGISQIDLVELDHAALECAKQNVSSELAQYHWADATSWKPGTLADTVIMNPPFHIGREADPDLGRAFIANAAKCLKPSGQLWMVANRHLPYEAELALHFATTQDVGGGTKFKVLHATKPKRSRR